MWKILALIGVILVSGCTPVVVGAGAAVVADEVAERKNGGRGLF